MRPGLQDSNPVSPSFARWWWLFVTLAAVIFVLATGYARVRQVDRVSATDRDSGPGQYASGRHWLVVPEHDARSYQWLAQTEQMLDHGEWRVRQVSNENAPDGRKVQAASPYRWWLGLIAKLNQTVTGQATAPAVEFSALWAGPLLHVLLLLTTAAYVARRFGRAQAAFFALGLAILFPLAGDFVPGMPDDHMLAIAYATWTVLLVAGGIRGSRADFIWSGIAGGLGLWVSVGVMVPVLGAIALGALVASAMDRAARTATPHPWDRWALAGAVTSLFAYFAEYYPEHLDLRLQTNHPLYGVAWLGLGQLLMLAGRWSRRELKADRRALGSALAALIGLATLPVAMKLTASPAFLIANSQAGRLAGVMNSPVAPSLAAWLRRDGLSLALAATLLPFVWLLPVGWAALKSTEARRQAGFAVGLLVVAVALACTQLQAWGWVQVVLLVAVVGTWPKSVRVTWIVAAFALLPGLVQLVSTAQPRDTSRFSHLETEGLIERDIAHWIADHADIADDQDRDDQGNSSGEAAAGPIVLVSPDRTSAFNYFGGLRGLGTPDWENESGVTATLRILGSTTAEEARAQLVQRGITHLVILSWDNELDTLVKWTSLRPEDTFLSALHRWALPPWLQPLPYRMPATGGFEDQSVVVFRVTENLDRALALSRMAEYALEVQDQPLAAAVDDSLQAFPASLVALGARAQLAKAREDNAAFERVLAPLLQAVTNRLDRTLPWDRRASLAVVLAQAGRTEQATTQLRRCVTELTESRLRTLSPSALYRLLAMSRALNVPLPEKLRESALALLPAEARARL